MKATLPDLTSMLRLDGGSGAVFIEAVQVSQSLMVLWWKKICETRRQINGRITKPCFSLPVTWHGSKCYCIKYLQRVPVRVVKPEVVLSARQTPAELDYV